MKKTICFLLALFLLLPVFGLQASAAAGDPEFHYELTVDGKDTVEVDPGDIITVTLHLLRTDVQEPYTMYAMQDEIRYDSNFLELVEGSALLSSGIQSTDIGLVDHHREFYMNFLSFSGGVQWEPKTRVGSFQLKVTGESGVTTITNEDFLVSLKDGSGSYPCDANKLTIILSTECTIKFETNGGTPIDPVTAIYGEKLARPEDPIREGKRLVGWYRDIHLSQEWDFDSDTVSGSMTLYAKWEDAPVEAEPETGSSCLICSRPALILGLCLRCLLILILLLVLILLVLYFLRRKMRKAGKKRGKFERRANNQNDTTDPSV